MITLAEYKALEGRVRSFETLTKQLGVLAAGASTAATLAATLKAEFADSTGVDDLAAAQALLERARMKLRLPELAPSTPAEPVGGPVAKES